MSSTLRPSTPGSKRSRWDEGEGAFSKSHFESLPKRKPKPKTPKPEEGPSQPVVLTHTRPSYSIYAPPRTRHPSILQSRSVYCYERLNLIEEGSYGVVFRARDKQTGDIVALKKLKLDEEKHGFPITALREINALMACRHENVVGIREVVVGETLTQYAKCHSLNVLSPTRIPEFS
jgi:cell division cycle 2-like